MSRDKPKSDQSSQEDFKKVPESKQPQDEKPFSLMDSLKFDEEADELDDDMRESLAFLKSDYSIKTSKDLYEHFMNQKDKEVDRKLLKDLNRTQLDNEEFKVDPKTGKNKLYNVLNAYAMYDHEISYCQGMNFIVSLLLKHFKNEEDTFFAFVHLMEKHQWKYCFDMETTKLINLLGFLECVLETAWADVYNHIMDVIEISLVPVFASMIQTIFIYDSPESVATQIFDVFLLDGETVIFTLLLKMIEHKEEKILSLDDHDLLFYIRSEMSNECL